MYSKTRRKEGRAERRSEEAANRGREGLGGVERKKGEERKVGEKKRRRKAGIMKNPELVVQKIKRKNWGKGGKRKRRLKTNVR